MISEEDALTLADNLPIQLEEMDINQGHWVHAVELAKTNTDQARSYFIKATVKNLLGLQGDLNSKRHADIALLDTFSTHTEAIEVLTELLALGVDAWVESDSSRLGLTRVVVNKGDLTKAQEVLSQSEGLIKTKEVRAEKAGRETKERLYLVIGAAIGAFLAALYFTLNK